MKTWHLEMAVVAILLASVLLGTGAPVVELIGSAAVLAGFGHAQVSERMAAAQAAMSTPSVDCFRWSVGYFVAKEVLWASYFVLHHSWSALVGCVVFLLYAPWRARHRTTQPPPTKGSSDG